MSPALLPSGTAAAMARYIARYPRIYLAGRQSGQVPPARRGCRYTPRMIRAAHVEASSAYHEAVSAEVRRFVAVLSAANPAIPVPTCPGWDLAALAGHLGSTHRWVTAMAEVGRMDKLPYGPFRAEIPTNPAVLPHWLTEGAGRLLAVLASVPAVRPMWAWGADRSARFWSRRMLFEAAVHRADAELALGMAPRFPAEMAADGIDEFLANLPYAVGFAPKVANLRGAGQTIGLAADDTAWRITLGRDGFTWQRSNEDADAIVGGSTTDLLLFVYGRRRIGDPCLEYAGEPALLRYWVENSSI